MSTSDDEVFVLRGYVRAYDLADYLAKSRSTITRWRKCKKIRVQSIGRDVYVALDSLDKVLSPEVHQRVIDHFRAEAAP